MDWKKQAVAKGAAARERGKTLSKKIASTVKNGLKATTSIAGDAFSAASNWQNSAELSRWLTKHFSSHASTIASRAMDAKFIETGVGGSWHRLVDGGHSISGSWEAVKGALPDLDTRELIGVWTNEYWKDLITARGMPIVLLESTENVSEYVKHLDSVNVVEILGGSVAGVSIYSNWNDPQKLIASATSAEASSLIYANVVAPLVSLIALGRAVYLVRQSEQADLQQLLIPAFKGLSRSGANILLISVIPGGFLVHLSSGIVISIAHNYAWDKVDDNKEIIMSALKESLKNLSNDVLEKTIRALPSPKT